MADPFPNASVDEIVSDGFGAFLMSEYHAPDVAAKVRHEEMSAVPGQVECGPHTIHGHPDRPPEMQTFVFRELPCPGCGAVV